MTTKEEAIELGVKAQAARELFEFLGGANTYGKTAEQHAAQIREYETARANMHEARNRHEAALAQLR